MNQTVYQQVIIQLNGEFVRSVNISVTTILLRIFLLQ